MPKGPRGEKRPCRRQLGDRDRLAQRHRVATGAVKR
jgi:hypothetical protein